MTALYPVKDKTTSQIVYFTGAEIIAQSIVNACNKGNANAMNIALGLMGEKPVENIAISAGSLDALNEAFEALKGDGK